MNQLQIQEFMDYFSGSQHNFGEYIYSEEKEGVKIKGRPRTVTNKLITIEDYKAHLEGRIGLGVIPINENHKCKFGVIDVDVYNLDLSVYIEAIERSNFPIVPFRSKSGGLHLYVFFKEFESAKKTIEVLKHMSFLLSIDTLVKTKKNEMVEIFPKQTKLEIGKTGNWINLPYYNSDHSVSKAFKDGKELSLSEALIYIKKKRTNIETVDHFLTSIDFTDAPPCLQLVNILNPLDENSGRNNYLFSFGVYLKKKDEDFFEQQLYEVNERLKKPLDKKEVEDTILKSLRRKDYTYKCSSSPCQDFCNKKECQKREYGIGKNEGYFSSVECGQLFQYRTAQPYYEWEVKLQGSEAFKSLRFKSEDEIIKQDVFLRLCMRELHELPSKLKQSEWFRKVNQHLKEIKIVSVDTEEDTSPMMILRNLIVEFLTGRAMADTKDQIVARRVYYNVSSDEYFFRVKDLNDYVYVQKQFRYFSPGELHGILREMKCVNKTVKTENRKQIRVSALSRKDLDVLDSAEEQELFKVDFGEYSEVEY